ncbi:MAG: TIGR03885 family FMN-dependent LLM class oxidoreductase [Bradymonadaceae bacterium]
MAIIGYHASHEQFRPSDLLANVLEAEQAGFEQAMCSDHFHPWSKRQGQSGFSFAWLGAALQATASMRMGLVCAPGQRYHPAIVAQALATLGEMFPGRIWSALGSGQALNEAITGEPWPPKAERNARLKECVDVMRALWAGHEVSHHGRVVVEKATLYTRAERTPMIFGAAVTAETARWVAQWADGLITIAHPEDELQPILDAFKEGGGESKPIFLQVQVSWAPDEETALMQAHDQWRNNIFESSVLTELPLPQSFDAAGRYVRPEDMRGPVRVSSDLERHVDWLARDLELGCDGLFLHNVGPNQRAFIEAFGDDVLPRLQQ